MDETPIVAGAEEHALAFLAPRALAPQVLSGVVAPFCAYAIARHAGLPDEGALAVSAGPPALAVLVEWAWRRRLNVIGVAVLLGIAGGLAGLVIFKGNELMLKLRETAVTTVLALACLTSLVLPVRPVMFHIGRLLAGIGDRSRMASFDELWELPEARKTFARLTLVWGAGLLGEAALRTILALEVSTGVFLAVAPVATAIVLGSLLAITVSMSRRARRRRVAFEAAAADVTSA